MTGSEATIYEVADHAGVSIATVSRVINNSAKVRPETRQRVEAAMKQLKFVPSMAARGLSGGKSRSIGLAYPMYESAATFNTSCEEDSNVLYFDTIIRGASAQASALGYSLFTCTTGPDHSRGLLPIQQLSSTIDGLILADRVMSDAEAARWGKKLPVVLLSGSSNVKFGATVRADNETGMRELVEHLAHVHNVKRIGFMCGIETSPDSIDRLRTITEAASRLKMSLLSSDILIGDYSMMRAEVAMERRITFGDELPEAIICANDQMAVGVIHTLREHGLSVPKDILVTGFDDYPIARMTSPALTTVRQSGFGLGVSAVNLMVGLLEGTTEKGTTVTLPTELVVRRSCGCPAKASRHSKSEKSK